MIDAGAHGITVHPRPDQRHIRADDCLRLGEMAFPSSQEDRAIELNLEGNPFTEPQRSGRSGVGDYPGFMALVERVRPTQVTLVPDGDDQLTSDHGFDIEQTASDYSHHLAEGLGLPAVCSWIRYPSRSLIFTRSRKDRALPRPMRRLTPGATRVLYAFQRAAKVASEHHLGINAGHDLNLRNLPDFLYRIF